MSRGFTLVELVICLAIFIFMTALLVSKYGNFNQSTFLTDTAYDVALALHTAQTYGLSVKNAGAFAGSSSNFNAAYGVDFNAYTGTNCGIDPSNSGILVLFADIAAPAGVCTSSDSAITSYTIARGTIIYAVCAGSSALSCASGAQLDVTFLRPDPDASICLTPVSGSATCSYAYGQVVLKGSDGSRRTISIYQNGQIAVSNS